MPISDYLRDLRARVGNDLLLLPSAAVAVLDDRNRVLLGKHADRDLWVLPGGLIEPGELPADAAVREAWEETGLWIELLGVLGVYGGPELVVHYPNGDRAAYVATVFHGRVRGGELRPDGVEILEARYFAETELSSLRLSPWLTTAKGAIFGGRGEARFQDASWRPDQV